MTRATIRRAHPLITAFIISFTFTASLVWYASSPTITKGDEAPEIKEELVAPRVGKSVVIYLQKMELELRDGDVIIATLPILSKGKPGSYYETIGGNYTSDYKVPLHFSSIGHVYMPHSVHLFGNYFIHGIPYYPNGEQVSSTYSGGCIRLTNENALLVYNFIDRGTPIIVTKDEANSFDPTHVASTTLTSIEMTNLMVAAVSLEFLTQDNEITDTDGVTSTTRRAILSRLITSGDTSVARKYAQALGMETFVSIMNQKAKALGLTNTHFENVESPVATTYEDYVRFMTYISTYKSYLRTVMK